MKKRILSVLLLLAMLVTMIPVTATVAAAEETVTNNSSSDSGSNTTGSPAEKPVAGELQDWYVQEGLTNLFTTFGKANGVDYEAGTWTAKVGTGVATLGIKARWSAGEFGGLGFNVLYGTVAEDGSYTTESSFNNHHTQGLKLNFGISVLPTGDYTVEYLAMYKPIYVADAEGNILVKDGAKVEAFDAFDGALPTGWLSGNGGQAIDNIGWYSSYTNRVDGVCSVYSSQSRGQTFWCFDNPTWYAGHQAWRYLPFKTNDAYQTNNAIRLYSITLGETLTIVPTEQTVQTPVVDEEGNAVLDEEGNPTYTETTETVDVRKTDASFGVYRDAALYYNKLNASTANAEGGTHYYDIDTDYKSNAGFSLSNSRPTDFFAARVYDRVLTEAEMRINRMVDLLLYYGIELSKNQLANDLLRTVLSNTLADVAFETESGAKAATKAEILVAIAQAEDDVVFMSDYAAPESLTAFFSVYADNALNLTQGTWRNLIGGANATFGTNWTQKANGSFGFDMWAGYMTTAEDGSTTYTAGKSGVAFPTDAYISNNNPNSSGYALNIGLSNLSTEDFTVEYQALYRPVLVVDANKSTAEEIVYYEKEGALLAAYDIDGNSSIPDVVTWACDVFGWFSTRTMNTDGGSGWGSTARGTVHWMVGLPVWGQGSNYKFVGGGWAAATSIAAGYHAAGVNAFYTYAVSVDETVTATGDTEALLTAYRNAATNFSNASCINSTANPVILDAQGRGEGYNDYGKGYPTQTDFSGKYGNSTNGAYFYLSAGTPTDFLAVRAYDKVLSAEEQKQNLAVDVMKYYGITLSDAVKNDPVLYKLTLDVLANTEVVGDAAAKAAVKTEIENRIALAAENAAVINQYAAAEDLTALFTVYANGSLDLANGTWKNLIGTGDATIGNKDQWYINDDGSLGFDMFFGTYVDGTYTASVSGDGTSNYFTYGTRLNLGIGLLPADDFTLEYLAQYKPYYVTDGNGNLVYDDAGKAIETYNVATDKKMPQQDPGGDINRAVIRVGYLAAHTYNYDGAWGNSGARGSGTQWGISVNRGWGTVGGCAFRPVSGSNYFVQNEGIHTYAITRAEVGASNIYAATYQFLKDGNLFYNKDHDGTTITASAYVKADFSVAEKTLTSAAHANLFWLSERHGTDFYTIRVYDRVLTEDERKFNIAVDAMNYYGIELPEGVEDDEILYNKVIGILATAAFVTGDGNKAIAKTEIEAKLDAAADEVALIKRYADPESLEALYTVFVDGTVDLAKGTWTDLVAAQTASLYTANKSVNSWRLNADGSVGFDVLRGGLSADGTFDAGAYNQTGTNIRLEFGLGQLPEGDFTVEYTAMYKPLYVRDMTVTDQVVIAKDAEGNLVETYDYNNRVTGNYLYQPPVDRLGWFANISQSLDGNGIKDWLGSQTDDETLRGHSCWAFMWQTWGASSWNGGWLGSSGNAIITGLAKKGDAYQTNGALRTYAITVDETVSGTGEDRVTQGAFLLYRDAVLYNSSVNSTANGTTSAEIGKDPYHDVDVPYSTYPSNTGFWLSNRRGTDFYTVRIYEKALTSEEYIWNSGVDTLLYYDIALDAASLSDKALLTIIYTAAANTALETDVLAKEATKAELVATIESAKADAAIVNQYAAAENMTALFTVYADGSVDLTNGTWRNLLGSGNATFGNKGEWSLNADGSVGFNMYYGTYVDGTYTASVNGDGTSNYFTYGTRLDLGIDLLPADDFTLEYLAQYKPYYVTDGNGNLVYDDAGNAIETYVATAGKGMPTQDPGGSYDRAVIRIGYLNALTYTYDGSWGNGSGARGNGTRWTISGVAGWSGSNSCTIDPRASSSEFFVTNAGIRTYAITRDEVGAENIYGATYQFLRDGVVGSTHIYDGTKVVNNGNGYTMANFSVAEKTLTGASNANRFWLSERHGTDFYTIRIYNRVLTEDERKQNIAVDVINYYGIELPDEIVKDATLYKMAIGVLAATPFVTGEEAKEAKKVEIEASFVDLAAKKAIIDSYAAPESLTAFYTVFHDGTVDLAKGTWTDIVSGKTAKLYTANANYNAWKLNADGSVGFDLLLGGLAADGTYTGFTVQRDNNIRLDFGISQLPEGDFTVEYTAKYKPTYLRDMTVADKYVAAIDGNGNPLETYSYEKRASGLFITNAMDHLGWFSNVTTMLDGQVYRDWAPTNNKDGDDLRGLTHWHYALYDGGWYGDYQGAFVGSAGNGATAGLAKIGDPYQTNGQIRNYAIILDETVDESGLERVTEGNLILYRDTALYDSAERAGGANSTANGTTAADKAKDPYVDVETPYASGTQFWLSNRRPTDFYAVRIYDKVLTEAELQHNHLIDLLYYYDITLPEEIAASAELKAQFAALVAGVEMTDDPFAKSAAMLAFDDAIDVLLSNEVYSLYVQDGLTSHFSALTPVDTSASAANGTWQNRVTGAASAVLGNSNLWTRNTNGSIGYNLFYGEMAEDGTVTEVSKYNTYSTSENLGTQLDLGIDLLPGGDFTVEYVAQYKPIYVADKYGDIAVDAEGNFVETYNVLTLPKRDPGSYLYGAENRIGYLSQHVYPQDGKWANGSGYRGDGFWTIGSSTSWGATNLSQFGSASTGPITGNAFNENAGVRSYAITRALIEDANNSRALYEMIRDGQVHTSKDFDSDTVLTHSGNQNSYAIVNFSIADKDLKAHYLRDKDGNVTANGPMSLKFWLSERHPTDFYAVRIYDRVLSDEELAQNHLIDIVIYYGLELDESVYEGTEAGKALLKDYATALNTAEIATDALAKAANREEYQAAIDLATFNASYVAPSNYDELYVTKNLVGLYTAFAGDTSANIVSGVWKNKATGSTYGDATFYGNWTKEKNGVGYRIEASTIAELRKQATYGISLPNEFENLDNFTVEIFATAYGATDANGDRVTFTSEPFVSHRNNFRFGLLTALGFPGVVGSSGLNNRWAVSNVEHTGSNWTNVQAYTWQVQDGTKVDEEGNPVMKSINTIDDKGWYTFGVTPTAGIMTVTKTTADNKDVSYAVTYGNAITPSVSFDVPAADYEALKLVTTTDDNSNRRFSLFNTMPATVHAVRVYSDELTMAEALQNSFADKAAYYQLEVDNFLTLGEEQKTQILNLFATIDMNRRTEDIQALYDFYAAGAADQVSETAVAFKGIEPILAGASGYRAIFMLNKSAYDLLIGAGYTVKFGALVAPGGVYNTVDQVILGAEGVKNVQVGGEGGSEVFYNLHGAGAWQYSAAITAEDAAFFGVDMIVRGYISIEKAGEETVIAYDDASLNGDAQVSILDAADYFVNGYDGDLVFQYKYMNSAALRAILEACGYTARTEIGDDIVIFVDAENGDDANSGLNANEAYKTLNAAFNAAKAHFAQAGRKTVVLHLADGVYTITEELELTADDIIADSYALEVVGSENTEINALKEIVYDKHYEVEYDDEGNEILYPNGVKEDLEGNLYIQLPQNEDGTYPSFRALYGDFAAYDENSEYVGDVVNGLLDISHIGTSDETFNINDFYILDEEGNKLSATQSYDSNGDGVIDGNDNVTTDWALTSTDYQKAKWGVFKLPVDMFPTDSTMGITLENYAGAELHFTWIWESSAVHIDHVEAIDGDDANVLAYVAFGQFPSAYKGGNKVKGREAWLENALVLADMGDGYYYDASTGKLYYPMADLTSFSKLSYATLDNIFVFKNVENITIRNISITGLDSNYLTSTDVGMHLGQAGSLVLRNNAKEATSIGHVPHAAIYGETLTGLTVQNVKVQNVLGAGVTVRGLARDVVVDSSSFVNIGGSAIQLSHSSSLGGYAKNIVITNNYVNTTGQLYRACAAIMTGHTANAKIIGNTVIGATWSSFALGQSWAAPSSSIDDLVNGGQVYTFDLEVAYNYVTGMMTCTGDGGAFYLNGAAVSIKSDDANHYNFLHHNYVVVDDVSGLLGENENGWRNVYTYYFENSTSNWYSYENVLINEVNNNYPAATFLGVYLQTYEGGEARNVEMVDNYFVGFDRVVDVYRGNSSSSKNPQAEFGQSASDYIYASVEDLINDNAVVGTHANATSKASKADAAEAVAAIFGAAGSSLNSEGKLSYLTDELDATPAADRVIRKDGELVKVEDFGNVELHEVIFTDGTTTITLQSLEGAAVKAPAEFAKSTHNYTFYVDGEVVDLATLTVPNGGMTITVVAEEKLYDVVFRGEVAGDISMQLPEGAALELPAELVRPGMIAKLVYDGATLDLATFKMPAKNIEIRVSYEAANYEITFVDAENDITATAGGKYGTVVTLPRVFAKDYHTAVYKVDGETITIGKYTVPDHDVTIDVEYVPNQYEVFFKADLTDVDGTTVHTYGSVFATYGEKIDASTIETAVVNAGGYSVSFNGWKNFTSGAVTLDENLLIADGNDGYYAEVYADYTVTAREFELSFKLDLTGAEGLIGDALHTYGTITVTYGQAIDASSIQTPDLEGLIDGKIVKFSGWKNLPATLVADENGVIPTEFYADYTLEDVPEDTGIVGDLNNDTYVTMEDVLILVSVVSGEEPPVGVVVDLNNDTYVTMEDVLILVSIVSGAS